MRPVEDARMPAGGIQMGPGASIPRFAATNEFTKGDPKNYLADDAIVRIADTFNARKEVEKYSRIVGRDEIAKNDFPQGRAAVGVGYRRGLARLGQC